MLVRGVVRMTVGLSERRVCKQTRTVSMQFTSKKIVCHEAYFSKSSHSKALWSKAFLSGSCTTNSTLALLRIVRCENRQSSHLASIHRRCGVSLTLSNHTLHALLPTLSPIHVVLYSEVTVLGLFSVLMIQGMRLYKRGI